MKLTRFALVAAVVLGTIAFAATQFTRIFNLQVQGKSLFGTTTETSNVVTRVLGGSIAFDFASVTITCEDSTGITVTGALAGDACFVGPPTTISGAGTGLHSSFTCYVSAADTVKVRHCAAGTADNPASATYYVRVISAQ
jgi:hypothetical protein